MKREGLGWTVKSQDKKSNKTYSITRIDSACACPEDPCLHGLVCDCPDFKHRKMPCKHIVKVLDVEHNNQGRYSVLAHLEYFLHFLNYVLTISLWYFVAWFQKESIL